MNTDPSRPNAPRALELLAPARDADMAIQAVLHGADAVYIGAEKFGARAAAGNSVADIARAADYAHRYGARIYITVNTLLYDSELKAAEQLIGELYRAGADALIIQDLGLLRLDLPPIALHASTQCDVRTPERARFLQDAGMSQIVVARELSVSQMTEIVRAVSVPVEAFVHGALCVSYSGQCYASLAATGRSANRGECAQICRLPFNLEDESGRVLMRGKHLLSLRDLDRGLYLRQMADAGISSFKIEGRLKEVAYVKNITAHYSRLLDEIVAASPELYRRSSSGHSDPGFEPNPAMTFNRGYTHYFTEGTTTPRCKMACPDSPKHIGVAVATVVKSTSRSVQIKPLPGVKAIAKGDGLGYFDRQGQYAGFRVNRTEGSMLFTPAPVNVPEGTMLYRNRDKAWDDLLDAARATRRIAVDVTLRLTPAGIVAKAVDEDGHMAAVNEAMAHDQARTPQEEARKRIMEKCGATCFELRTLTDCLGATFVTASQLTALRRRLLEALEATRRVTRAVDYRRPTMPGLKFDHTHLTYADNVANSAARDFYTCAGALTVEPAAEMAAKLPTGSRVMTTRYCLRRECGRCLRTPAGGEWPHKLTLSSGRVRLGVEFDCKNCEMHLFMLAK